MITETDRTMSRVQADINATVAEINRRRYENGTVPYQYDLRQDEGYTYLEARLEDLWAEVRAIKRDWDNPVRVPAKMPDPIPPSEQGKQVGQLGALKRWAA